MSFFVILVYFGRNSTIKYLLKSGKNGKNFTSFNKKLLISLLQWLSTAPLPKGDEYQWDYFPNKGEAAWWDEQKLKCPFRLHNKTQGKSIPELEYWWYSNFKEVIIL